MAADSLQLKLFRREAIAGARQRWLGDVAVATAPSAPVAMAAAACACIAVCASTVLVQVPERIDAAGMMLPAGRIVRVHAPRAGTVAKLAVREGDSVIPAQVLLDLETQEAAGRLSGLDARRDSLQRELALLDEQDAAAEVARLSTVASDRQRIAIVRQQIKAAGAEEGLFRAQLEIAERKLERGHTLRDNGGIALQQVDSLEAEALQARVRHAAAGDKRFALERELALIDAERHRRRDAETQQDLRLARERENLRRALLDVAERRRTTLVAPIAGVVGGLLVTNGSMVQGGELLMQVAEQDAELQAHVYISADDAGRVRTGQEVELRLRAYPYRLHGTYAAKIRRISTVPLPVESLGLPMSGTGLVYELRATPVTGTGTRDWPVLTPGATFEAEVITRRWRLYRWLLRGRRQPA